MRRATPARIVVLTHNEQDIAHLSVQRVSEIKNIGLDDSSELNEENTIVVVVVGIYLMELRVLEATTRLYLLCN